MKNKKFLIKDLFNIYKGTRLTKDNMIVGETNYLGAIDNNNGVRQKIDSKPKFSGNYITVNYNGSVGEAFYQNKPFWASDDVNILELKNHVLNKNIAMYLITVIRENKNKFSYGRKWTMEKMLETEIALPCDDKGNPNWQYMENYIKSLNIKFPITKIMSKDMDLDTKNWKEFLLSDLFTVTGTKTTKLDELETYGKGEFPYVTTQAVDNGVAGYYNISTEKGNVLTIDSAVIGYCSYQERDFSASDHVEKLIPKFEMNKYIALFLVTLLNTECYKYSYGRKANQIKIRNVFLKLPINEAGCPNWQFMENYIKSLPYSDNI